jgi:hypothetical protein
MKKLLPVVLILGLVIPHGYAQTADQKGQATEQKGMMGSKEVTDRIAGMMSQMAELLGKMPTIMTEEVPPPDIMETRFEIMKDMSQQMLDMSKIIRAGAASEKAMRRLQDKLADIQKRMSELEAKD